MESNVTENYPVLFPFKRDDFSKFSPSSYTIGARFFRHIAKGNGCWNWVGHCHRNGYAIFQLNLKSRKKGTTRHMYIRCSRLMWVLTHGEIPEGLKILHRCDNRSCVNPSHLFLGTSKDNYDDAVSKGRLARGLCGGFLKISPHVAQGKIYPRMKDKPKPLFIHRSTGKKYRTHHVVEAMRIAARSNPNLEITPELLHEVLKGRQDVPDLALAYLELEDAGRMHREKGKK